MDSIRKEQWCRGAVVIIFTVAGVLHIVFPGEYRKVMPPYIPTPEAMILISGIAEMLGGIGIIFRPVRMIAGYGLILLLVAVFPVNIHMFWKRWMHTGWTLATVLLLLRLPLQFLLMRWVWLAMGRR